MKAKEMFGKALLRTLGDLPYGMQWARNLAAKLILKQCGERVTIRNGVHLTGEISIGEDSIINPDCWLYGPIEIGKWVMIAREAKIYTQNHNTRDTTVPMRTQGHTPPPARL